MSSQNSKRLLDQMELMQQMGYHDMVVSELATILSTLPPMMPIYINADNVSMFLNGYRIEKETEESAPYCRLFGSIQPLPNNADLGALSYEERVALQRERAMEMARQMEEAKHV